MGSDSATVHPVGEIGADDERAAELRDRTELEPSLITARAGLPSLIEVYRLSGTAAVIEKTVKFKTRKRGLTPSEMVESFLALWAAGGERAEDFDHAVKTQRWPN